jgi:hypothetical protein
MTGNGGRRAAQRMFDATSCEVCGGGAILQCHHKDGNPTNNAQTNIALGPPAMGRFRHWCDSHGR